MVNQVNLKCLLDKSILPDQKIVKMNTVFFLLFSLTYAYISIPIDRSFDKGSYWIISGRLSQSLTPDLVTGSQSGNVTLYRKTLQGWKSQRIAYIEGV